MSEPQARNPYRRPKPKNPENILWRGAVWEASEKGRARFKQFGRVRAILTPQCLWLSRELVIPLLSLKSVSTISDGRALRIVYCHGLLLKDEVVHLCILNFFSRRDRKRLEKLKEALLSAWKRSVDEAPEGVTSALEAAQFLARDSRCERCGSPHAAVLDSGYVVAVGILFLAWGEWRRGQRLYLCRRHAIFHALWNNLITSAVGHIGFPAILVGQIQVWTNALNLKRSHKVSATVVQLAGLSGTLLPAVVVILLWRWVSGWIGG
jgi:hypothetical protein